MLCRIIHSEAPFIDCLTCCLDCLTLPGLPGSHSNGYAVNVQQKTTHGSSCAGGPKSFIIAGAAHRHCVRHARRVKVSLLTRQRFLAPLPGL